MSTFCSRSCSVSDTYMKHPEAGIGRRSTLDRRPNGWNLGHIHSMTSPQRTCEVRKIRSLLREHAFWSKGMALGLNGYELAMIA